MFTIILVLERYIIIEILGLQVIVEGNKIKDIEKTQLKIIMTRNITLVNKVTSI